MGWFAATRKGGCAVTSGCYTFSFCSHRIFPCLLLWQHVITASSVHDGVGDALIEQFWAELERVPWFESLGKPVEAVAGVLQIFAWEAWPGPDDPTVMNQSLRQQDLYDALLAAAEDRTPEAKQLWERIHAIVFRDAAPRVPYDSNQDCWHAPTQSVWNAAWTAGLVGLCLFLGRPIPPELAQQWTWYTAGHWPCAWFGDYPEGRLMVY